MPCRHRIVVMASAYRTEYPGFYLIPTGCKDFRVLHIYIGVLLSLILCILEKKFFKYGIP
jgi:hypothetical protein